MLWHPASLWEAPPPPGAQLIGESTLSSLASERTAVRWLSLPGVLGHYPSSPPLDAPITGDIDIRFCGSCDWANGGTTRTLVSQWNDTSPSPNPGGWLFRKNGNFLRLDWFDGAGGQQFVNGLVSLPATWRDDTVHWVRVTMDVDTGAGAGNVKFWISDDGEAWQMLEFVLISATSICANQSNIEVGSYDTGTTNMLSGRVYRAQVYRGIDGELVRDFNPADALLERRLKMPDYGYTTVPTRPEYNIGATGSVELMVKVNRRMRDGTYAAFVVSHGAAGADTCGPVLYYFGPISLESGYIGVYAAAGGTWAPVTNHLLLPIGVWCRVVFTWGPNGGRLRLRKPGDTAFTLAPGDPYVPQVNVARDVLGCVATASSVLNANYVPSGTNNGNHVSTNWNTPGGGWNQAAGDGAPWLQVTFNKPRTVHRVDVTTLPDDFSTHSAEPTLTDTFTLYGLTAYRIQTWDDANSVWITQATITGNNKVRLNTAIPSTTTTKIRILCDGSPDGNMRIVEVDAWSWTADVPLGTNSYDINTGVTGGSDPGLEISLADLRWWNVERTEAELLATDRTHLDGNEEGLVGYFKLDDRDHHVYDSSPLGNHGYRDGQCEPVFEVLSEVTSSTTGELWTLNGSRAVIRGAFLDE